MPLYQYRNHAEERTLCFIHIPKTGGSAINSYLKRLGFAAFFEHTYIEPIKQYLGVIPSHYDYEVSETLYRLDLVYSFAVVRNPIHKLVSEYNFHTQRQRSSLPAETKQLDFKAFLKFAVSKLEQDPNFWKGHFRPQHCFVGPKVRRVFRYEEGLNNIMTQVFEDVGLRLRGDVQIPVVNKMKSQPVLIDDEVLELIFKMYGEDFSRFGYRVEEPV